MKLNLGCGTDYRKEFVNVDCDPHIKKDMDFDLSGIFPIKDLSVEYINASHIIEHLPNLIDFMNECHRVLIDGGRIDIVTPKPNSEFYWQDPTHIRGYVANTFKIYFTWCPLYSYIKRWSHVETREEVQTHNGINAEILFVTMIK